jgi:transposase
MVTTASACPDRRKVFTTTNDAALYHHRHRVESAFLQLKRWRGMATRYAENADSFLAAAQIRGIAIWARVL